MKLMLSQTALLLTAMSVAGTSAEELHATTATSTDPTLTNAVPRDANYFPLAPRPTDDARRAGFSTAWNEFAKTPRVRIIVGIEVPEYERRRDESIAAKGADAIRAADDRLAASIKEFADAELSLLPRSSYVVQRRYPSLAALALEVSPDALAALEASPGVQSVALDETLAPMLDDTTEIIGATDAWAVGLAGSDWYVAVLDTGIRATHEAFAGKTVIQACFAGGGNCPNGADEDISGPDAARHYPPPYFSDHGTHVAGIAAGDDPSGSAQNDGVARGANLLAVQVFRRVDGAENCDGEAHCVLAFDSDALAAISYIYQLRSTYKIAAVNMSLGGGSYLTQSQCDEARPQYYNALATLRSVGIAPVAASGNDDWCLAMRSPGCLTPAIGVGATENDDDEAGFSNYQTDMIDIYAPGVDIFAPIGSGDADYGNKSGTSMATPHVAGAFALLRQAAPTVPIDELLTALQVSGAQINGRCATPWQRRIDVSAALDVLLGGDGAWVWFSWTGPENGSWRSPWNTLAEGVLAVPPNGTLWLHPGTTPALTTILTPMTLIAPYGPATIGQ